MPLDSLAAKHGGLDDFRITSPREIAAMLKQLADGNVRLNLNASDGSALGAMLWTVDTVRDRVAFSADENDPMLPTLLECDEAVVVGYLDSVKVQFDVGQLVLVRGGRDSVISAARPHPVAAAEQRTAGAPAPQRHRRDATGAAGARPQHRRLRPVSA